MGFIEPTDVSVETWWVGNEARLEWVLFCQANTDIFGFWNKLSSQLERHQILGQKNMDKSLDTEGNHGKTRAGYKGKPGLTHYFFSNSGYGCNHGLEQPLVMFCTPDEYILIEIQLTSRSNVYP